MRPYNYFIKKQFKLSKKKITIADVGRMWSALTEQ